MHDSVLHHRRKCNWEVIDMQNNSELVGTYPMRLKALNASRRLEPASGPNDPTLANCWRYLVRKAR